MPETNEGPRVEFDALNPNRLKAPADTSGAEAATTPEGEKKLWKPPVRLDTSPSTLPDVDMQNITDFN